MKKEIVAGAILIALLAASLVNMYFIETQGDKLTSQIEQAQQLTAKGENEAAAQVLSASIDDWKKLDHYVHVMMRHDEIDPISDEFYTLLSEIEGGTATNAGFLKLLSSLNALAQMERLSFSSVF